MQSVERYFKESFFRSSAQWKRLLFQCQLYPVTLMQHSASRTEETPQIYKSIKSILASVTPVFLPLFYN